ncbi:MAG: hypothetical protein ACK4VY_13160 [Brevundimonas sp.]
MSLTYLTDTTKTLNPSIDPARPVAADEAAFVPVYARRGKARGGQGKIKTWMILVPVGVAALAGLGLMMAMNGGEETAAPLAEPAGTAPVLSALPTETAAAPLTSAAAPEPVAAAPVVRQTAPAPRPAAAPVRRQAAAPARAPSAAPRVTTPAPATPTGPQAYAPAPAGPTTSTLNAAPATPAPTATPTPPVIIVEPVG